MNVTNQFYFNKTLLGIVPKIDESTSPTEIVLTIFWPKKINMDQNYACCLELVTTATRLHLVLLCVAALFICISPGFFLAPGILQE